MVVLSWENLTAEQLKHFTGFCEGTVRFCESADGWDVQIKIEVGPGDRVEIPRGLPFPKVRAADGASARDVSEPHRHDQAKMGASEQYGKPTEEYLVRQQDIAEKVIEAAIRDTEQRVASALAYINGGRRMRMPHEIAEENAPLKAKLETCEKENARLRDELVDERSEYFDAMMRLADRDREIKSLEDRLAGTTEDHEAVTKGLITAVDVIREVDRILNDPDNTRKIHSIRELLGLDKKPNVQD